MNMSLAQATELAALIHNDTRFVVIAIGRFVLIEELTQPGAADRPWGLTVLPRDKPERRVTLWSPEQWTEYRDLVLEELQVARKRPRKAAPPAAAAAATDAASPLKVPVTPTEDQLLLF